MKIAIIGAGISGLVCAHVLHSDHDVVVFEAENRPGGHANTVRVQTEQGAYDVDTGFIVYNDRNYPNFESLLTQLGVRTQPSQMSFGVSDGGDFEYNGASPNGLFARRAHALRPSFHRMLAPRALQPAGARAARLRGEPVAARVAGAAGLLALVHRAA